MIQSFHIENYKCFKELDIENVRKINLITGPNNVGKTTVLEAVYIYGYGNPYTLYKETRNWNYYDDDKIFDELFMNFNSSKAIRLFANDEDQPLTIRKIKSETGKSVEIFHNNKSRPIKRFYIGKEKDKVVSDGYDTGNGVKLKLLSPRLVLLEEELHDVFNQEIKMRFKQQYIVDILKKIYAKIEGVDSIPLRKDLLEFYCKVEGFESLVPLKMFGDSVIHALRRAIAFYEAADGGTVLIDEFENGIYHESLPAMWEIIDSLAEQFNTQVFVTTHSYECVQAFAEVFKDKDHASLIRLYNEDDTIKATTIDASTLSGLVDNRFEVR